MHVEDGAKLYRALAQIEELDKVVGNVDRHCLKELISHHCHWSSPPKLCAWLGYARPTLSHDYGPTTCEACGRKRTRTRPLGTCVVVEPDTRSCGFSDRITHGRVPGVVAIVLRSRYHQLFA